MRLSNGKETKCRNNYYKSSLIGMHKYYYTAKKYRGHAEAKIVLHILKRTELEMRKLYLAFASKSRKSFIKCYIYCDIKNCQPMRRDSTIVFY